ncbi:hypothetical protein HT136_22640 [Novosphingobium profundi]|uniref:hypothetical protein n=1 Tax=Novosphingobium profundi TaxID=1774954 RepID=UPI001BDA3916|nr:hypothetical protein [Novosphingobium profundi]MBT0671174.1 hypothetical protein [Novosphingobium profundi]
MQTQNAGVVAAEERAYVAHLLRRYPERLSPHEEADVANWFDRIASPADVRALIADPALAERYEAFRAARVHRSGPPRLVRTVLVLALVTTVVGALSLLAP